MKDSWVLARLLMAVEAGRRLNQTNLHSAETPAWADECRIVISRQEQEIRALRRAITVLRGQEVEAELLVEQQERAAGQVEGRNPPKMS